MLPAKKQRLWDYFILCARLLLAYALLNYGWGKLTGTQFGITEAEKAQPVKDVSFFRLAWYLFDQQPFKAFIGVSQLFAGGLLLFKRTALIGTLMAIPIWANIMAIDYSYMHPNAAAAFGWRIGWYLVLSFAILWHSRAQVIAAFKILTPAGGKFRFLFPWWAYLLLPLCVILLEFSSFLPRFLEVLLRNPAQIAEGFKSLFAAF